LARKTCHKLSYIYMEEDTDDVKYLKIVYDDINQLIEMIQSYQGTINSTRDEDKRKKIETLFYRLTPLYIK
jgi:Mg2+ and Co2+ transporter CorA